MVRKSSLLALATLGLGASVGGACAQGLPPLAGVWQDAIKPGAGVSATGVAQEFAYKAGPGGVTSVDPPSANLAATVGQSFGPSGEMTSLEILDGIRSVAFARANTDTFTALGGGRATFVRSSDWTRQAVVADPLALGWRYQSFAAWQTGLGQANGSMGASSFGRETGWNGALSAVPQTGAANFSGFMGGIYNDAAGQDHAVTAEVGVRMNFADHVADFFTANTVDRTGRVYDDLNISGTFLGLPNHPQMFGSLQTARLEGIGSARFFGPAAEEFGGVFTLAPKDGQGLERFAGAFGSTQGSILTPKAGSSVTLQAAGLQRQASAGYAAAAASADIALSQTVDAGGATSDLKLAVPAAAGQARLAATFSKAAGDQIAVSPDGWIRASTERGFTAGDTAGGKAGLTMANAAQLGWDYQTFGVWQGANAAANLSGAHGGASFGAATPDNAIPTSGAASFKGQAAADYAGVGLVTASATIAVDFGARSADFTTSAFSDAATGAAYAGTALVGAMTLQPGRNVLAGPVRTVDGALGGTLNGRFYGPTAQEIGGTFALAGQGHMIGAFGAKR